MRRLGAGARQHHLADLADQAELLRRRDEAVRRDQPAHRMPPAEQGLEAADLARPDIDQRLVEDLEFLLHDGAPQVGLQLVPGLHADVHLRLEEPEGPAPIGLRPVQRQVGAAQQPVGIHPVLRRDGDAEAGADDDAVALDLVGPADLGDDPPGERLGIARLVDRGLHDGELVPADARRPCRSCGCSSGCGR